MTDGTLSHHGEASKQGPARNGEAAKQGTARKGEAPQEAPKQKNRDSPKRQRTGVNDGATTTTTCDSPRLKGESKADASPASPSAGPAKKRVRMLRSHADVGPDHGMEPQGPCGTATGAQDVFSKGEPPKASVLEGPVAVGFTEVQASLAVPHHPGGTTSKLAAGTDEAVPMVIDEPQDHVPPPAPASLVPPLVAITQGILGTNASPNPPNPSASGSLPPSNWCPQGLPSRPAPLHGGASISGPVCLKSEAEDIKAECGGPPEASACDRGGESGRESAQGEALQGAATPHAVVPVGTGGYARCRKAGPEKLRRDRKRGPGPDKAGGKLRRKSFVEQLGPCVNQLSVRVGILWEEDNMFYKVCTLFWRFPETRFGCSQIQIWRWYGYDRGQVLHKSFHVSLVALRNAPSPRHES